MRCEIASADRGRRALVKVVEMKRGLGQFYVKGANAADPVGDALLDLELDAQRHPSRPERTGEDS
jgi:hypothetical protein